MKNPHVLKRPSRRRNGQMLMTEEYQSIIKNDVWEIVPRPKSKDVVSSKWLFKIKHVADGNIEKYKARFEKYKEEYIAACSTSCEAILLQNLLIGLFDL
jgi:hypothetical protein